MKFVTKLYLQSTLSGRLDILFLTEKTRNIDFFFLKTLADSKNSRTFASAIENDSNQMLVW